MPEAVEVTTFKLRRGVTVADFVAGNASINRWLKKQPGFRSRRICELPDGSVVDMLIWRTAELGSDAAARIVSETSDSPVHAMINQRTVIWRVAEVRQTSEHTKAPK